MLEWCFRKDDTSAGLDRGNLFVLCHISMRDVVLAVVSTGQ